MVYVITRVQVFFLVNGKRVGSNETTQNEITSKISLIDSQNITMKWISII